MQEDIEQGGFTLHGQLAAYIRECDLVIHLVGDACGARPTAESGLDWYSSVSASIAEQESVWGALTPSRRKLCDAFYIDYAACVRDPESKRLVWRTNGLDF